MPGVKFSNLNCISDALTIIHLTPCHSTGFCKWHLFNDCLGG